MSYLGQCFWNFGLFTYFVQFLRTPQSCPGTHATSLQRYPQCHGGGEKPPLHAHCVTDSVCPCTLLLWTWPGTKSLHFSLQWGEALVLSPAGNKSHRQKHLWLFQPLCVVQQICSFTGSRNLPLPTLPLPPREQCMAGKSTPLLFYSRGHTVIYIYMPTFSFLLPQQELGNDL